MTKEKKKINLIFDLDHCLFKTSQFFRALEKEFEKVGVSERLFLKTFQESKISPVGTWHPRLQIKLIKQRNRKIDNQKLSLVLNKLIQNSQKFLYPDVFGFLKQWKRQKISLSLITHGRVYVQRPKIKNAGLDRFFSKLIITPKSDKISALRRITRRKEINIFIDDRQRILVGAKKEFPFLITVLLKREKKNEKIEKEIDFQITKLKELDNLIKKIKKEPRCLILFSGGLDSMLAAKILIKQGIKTTGLTFKSYFFDEKQAEDSARQVGLKLKIVDFSRDHLKIVQKPKFGYGKSMNPCIDCHLLMFKKAKEIMKKESYDFIASGEVLNERPMSQNIRALKLIEKRAGLEGLILRPLSALILPPTLPEKLRWVKREDLYGIHGRSRKIQLRLARKFKIRKFPTPAGGCILTDLEFGKRLKELFKRSKKILRNDIELLRIGRHFWFNSRIKVVIGRNEKENEKLEKLALKGDLLISMENYPGPTVLIRNYENTRIPEEIVAKAKELILRYSPKARDKLDVKFLFRDKKSDN